jgi:hypothetical protein
MKADAYVLKGDRRHKPGAKPRECYAACLEGFFERRAEGIRIWRMANEIRDIRERKNLTYRQISDDTIRRAIKVVFNEALQRQEARDEAEFAAELAAQEALFEKRKL